MSQINEFDNIPKFINNYIIEKEIRKCNYGTIYSGLHKITDEKVAIKIISKNSLKTNINYLTLINNEISILKLLYHQNIIQLYEIIESSLHIYIITEIFTGQDLFHLIQNKKFLSEKDSKIIFTQIIKALYYIHKMKICHRNIKPENIIITENKKVKIINFEYIFYYNSSSNIIFDIIGNDIYTCPEMNKENEYKGELCDVWSCGILLYFMVTGNLPFNEQNGNLNNENINNGILNIPNYLSEDLVSLIKGMIEVDINKRFNLNDIIFSKWLNKNIFDINDGVNIFEMSYPIDKKILNLCQYYGFNKDLISFDIKNNLHNQNTALYKKKKKKIVNFGFQSISDLCSNEFYEYIKNPSHNYNNIIIKQKYENFAIKNQDRIYNIYNQIKNLKNTHEIIMNKLLDIEKEYNEFILNNPISEENYSISLLKDEFDKNINDNLIHKNRKSAPKININPFISSLNNKKYSRFKTFSKNNLINEKLKLSSFSVSDFEKKIFKIKNKSNNKNEENESKNNTIIKIDNDKKEEITLNFDSIDFSKDEILKLTIEKKNKEEEENCNIQIIDEENEISKDEILDNIKSLQKIVSQKNIHSPEKNKFEFPNQKIVKTVRKIKYSKNKIQTQIKNKSKKDINQLNINNLENSLSPKNKIINQTELQNQNTFKKNSISQSRSLKNVSSFKNISNNIQNKLTNGIIKQYIKFNNNNDDIEKNYFYLNNHKIYENNLSNNSNICYSENKKNNSEKKILKRRFFSLFLNKNHISDFTINNLENEQKKKRKSSLNILKSRNDFLSKNKNKSSNQSIRDNNKLNKYKNEKNLHPRKYKGPIDLLLISYQNINETINYIKEKLKSNKFYSMCLSKFKFKCIKNVINFQIEIVEIDYNIYYFLFKIKRGAEKYNIRNLFS